MASQSSALEIAGGGIRPAFFGHRDLPIRSRSLQINRTCRPKASAPACLTFHPAPAHASTVSPVRLDLLSSFTRRARDERERITPEKLEEMIHESMDEIVRNIGRAPFLMLVFLDEGGRVESESESESRWRLCSSSSPPLILEREAATAESWQRIKQRWEDDSCVPDGVILVEELEKEKDGMVAAGGGGIEEGDSRRWGVVIEGRGMDFSACFILKTCRVRSSIGYCTHYSLVRAQCFGDPVGVQLMNAWLQRERCWKRHVHASSLPLLYFSQRTPSDEYNLLSHWRAHSTHGEHHPQLHEVLSARTPPASASSDEHLHTTARW